VSRRRGTRKPVSRRRTDRGRSSRQAERARLQADLDQAAEWITAGQADRAIDLLEPYLGRFAREADLHYLLGTAHNRESDFEQALEYLETAERLGRGAHHPFQLAITYSGLGMDVHVLRALRRYLKVADPDDPALPDARAAVADLEAQSEMLAKRAGTSVSKIERAHATLERGKLAIERNDFDAALLLLEAAVRMAPGLVPAHNNLALALFHLDRSDEAIAVEERVVEELDPDSAFALANLIWLLVAVGRRDRALAYRSRLVTLLPTATEASLWRASEAFAVLGDHQQVVDLLKAEDEETLTPREWNMLGAAAGNLGRLEEARRCFQEALRMVPDRWEADTNLQALERGDTGWGPDEGFAYFSAWDLLPMTLIERVEHLPWDEQDADQLLEELHGLRRTWPALVDTIAYPLWAMDDVSTARESIDMLGELGTPRTVRHLRAYAFGQIGEYELRQAALFALSSLGDVPPSETVRIWDGEAWQELKTLGFQIAEDEEEWPYDAVTSERLDVAMQAHDEGESARAKALYQEVLEREPAALEALVNLGALWAAEGEIDKAEALYRRALEVDPLSPFALCNLARIHLRRDEVDQALDLVHRAMENRQLTPEAFRLLQTTHATVLVEQEEYEKASQVLQMYLQGFPDDPDIQEWLGRLALIQSTSRLAAWWRENADRYADRHRRKPISATDLDSLMARLTKSAYVGMYRALQIDGISGLRKAEMGEAIAARLRDQHFLAWVVRRLDDAERAALRYALRVGGVMPYADATVRFGDESDDSPYWEYHEPDSTVGRLRRRGLLFAGELDGQLVLVVPDDLRAALRELLGDALAAGKES
jgi:tetratricopeptide (TPR) repeat protein